MTCATAKLFASPGAAGNFFRLANKEIKEALPYARVRAREGESEAGHHRRARADLSYQTDATCLTRNWA
jgi:hypothetical protein